jgi:hypothetical protein
MERNANYVWFASHPRKVYGPFTDRAAALAYTGSKGTVQLLTGNEILRCRLNVIAPISRAV